MKRRKHKNDGKPAPTVRNWQGWASVSNKMLRKKIKTIDDVPSGSFYKKICTWFEWN